MLGSKPIRKNFFKNSVAKKRAKIFHHFKIGLKITAAMTALLLISGVAIFGYDFFTQCGYFNAQNLLVTGNQRLPADQVLKFAHIEKGINILSLNLATARKRLLAHSWIAEAEISRELPSDIHIRIKEHTPLAIMDLGRKFLINTQGEIFKEVAAQDPQNLPIISGLEFSDITVNGDSRSLPFDAVLDILRLGQESNSVIPNSMIRKIKVDREIGLTIYAPYFESGLINAIKIGYHEYASKFAGLKYLIRYLKNRPQFLRIESIDLNDLNRIVVNPATINSAAIPLNEQNSADFSTAVDTGKNT